MKSSLGPWYVVKVKYTKQLDSGELKRVNEAFLVKATSYTDAEAKATEEISKFVKGELLIGGITKANFAEVLQRHDGDFPMAWVVAVSFESFDADSEKTKKSVSTILVVADNIVQAINEVVDLFVHSVSDFEIVGAKLSPIMDILESEEMSVEKIEEMAQSIEEDNDQETEFSE